LAQALGATYGDLSIRSAEGCLALIGFAAGRLANGLIWRRGERVRSGIFDA